jgi:hypothetical protein
MCAPELEGEYEGRDGFPKVLRGVTDVKQVENQV